MFTDPHLTNKDSLLVYISYFQWLYRIFNFNFTLHSSNKM